VQNRHKLFRASYYIVWAVFLALFSAFGAHQLWICSHGKFIESGPSASTDAYLEALLKIRNGSQTCLLAMSKLRRGPPIVYFSPPRSAEGDFVYDVLAYLSWPRKIDKVETSTIDLEHKIASADQASTAAFIFFRMRPPSKFSPSWHVGPNLVIVPMNAAQ
jgi:hypothetical protein